jgi:hypothetical protein
MIIYHQFIITYLFIKIYIYIYNNTWIQEHLYFQIQIV